MTIKGPNKSLRRPSCDRPATAGEALSMGVERLNAGEAEAAVELFQAALGLPGKGAMRLKNSPREYR